MEIIKRNPDISKPAKFFMANAYCSNLRYYLKSKFVDSNINHEFLLNKRLLYQKMSGRISLLCVIKILRFIPIKLLLKIFGK